MEGRGSRGPGPDRIRPSRLRLTGTRGYPYPQVPTQVTQPVEYGANQVHFGQVQCFNGYRLPSRDPRQRTWSQLGAAYCGSTAAVASLAAPPTEAATKRRPSQGPAPTDPRQALLRGASRHNHRPSTSSGPSSQAPQRHPVTGADVQKEFAVPHAVASSRTPQGQNGCGEPSQQELLVRIEKVDEDLAEDESRVEFLNNRELELELEVSSSADKANDKNNDQSDVKVKDKIRAKIRDKVRGKLNGGQDAALLKLKLASTFEAIYSKNNETARLEHASFDNLGPKVDQPLYHQPSDNSVYHENERKFLAFKKRLMSHIKQTALEEKNRRERETEKYNQLMECWKKEMEDRENTAANKTKKLKQREIFEKEFPELKKQRESRERFLRAGNRVRSDAHMEEIIGGLQEQENADRKMRQNAAVLPVIVDLQERRRPRYCDHNRLVRDMAATHSEHQKQSTWTDQEKEIFLEKFAEFPKDFGKIASFLEKKSVSECVRYYYLTKKKENPKQLRGKGKRVQRKKTNWRGKRNSKK
ncbi:hypothetical protein MTO96_013491 [Rhipicephalus appendiculatus]